MSEGAVDTGEAQVEGTTGTVLDGAGESQPAAREPGAWFDDFSAELKSNPTLQRYQGKSFDDFGRSFLEHQKKAREQGLHLPGENASPEQVRAAMTALGCPEDPSGYDLSGVEGAESLGVDEGFQQNIMNEFHHLGLTPAQARGVYERYVGLRTEQVQAVAQAQAEVETGWGDEIKRMFGGAFDAKVEAAQRAMRAAAGTPEVAEQIAGVRMPNGGRLGNYPAFVKLMAAMGELMSENGEIVGDSLHGSRVRQLTPEEAEGKLTELRSDPEWMKAWADPMHAGHKKANAEYMELMQAIEPEEGAA